MDRLERIAVFEDTIRRFKEDACLKEQTGIMQTRQILYLEDFEAVVKKEKSEIAQVKVLEGTTFDTARCSQTADKAAKVAVLNFANAYHPGGGVANGAGAQEECLCRCSNLYFGLNTKYMLKHYYKWNSKNTGDMGTDHLIYSPGITVIKDDEYNLLKEEDVFQVDVITCAAPYLDLSKKHPVSMDNLEDIFYSRWKNILEVAIANDVDILILGAFGCGAFNNPPEIVSRALYHLLVQKRYRNYFRQIVLAIKKNDSENSNLTAFSDQFLCTEQGNVI